MKNIILIIVLLLFNITLSQEGVNTEFEINFNNSKEVYQIDLSFKEVKSVFIVDSGAGHSSISKELEKELLDKNIISEENYTNPGLYRIADGSIIKTKVVIIPQLEINGYVVYNLKTSIANKEGAENLLGQSFLNRYSLWTLDNKNSKLIVYN